MLIELHLLTPHAPSNLNRDDFGRPKTAYFGGTERGRISSQALKRAIRKSTYVAERLGEKISTRSLHIPLQIYRTLENEVEDKERLGIVCEAIAGGLGKAEKIDKEDEFALKTSQIVFLTRQEIENLTDFARRTVEGDEKLTKKAIKALSKTVAKESGIDTRPTDGVDVALFGRMTTDDAGSFQAVDASMQVAHPIATHTTITETDYFTAVDDWKQDRDDERGSGHIGELDFNSAVYYKYFSCDFDLLTKNLGGDRAAALEALEVVYGAACIVTPSGKQNSFASHSPAETALLVVRDRKTPCSLAAAFERPVAASEKGYVAESQRRMLQRYERLVEAYNLGDEAIVFTLEGDAPKSEAYDATDRLADVWAFLRRAVESDAAASTPTA